MAVLQGFRIVNITANKNSIIYPDVYFPIDGSNTLLDMQNGGGKTLAIQMLFQTILPNSEFSSKNKIKNLFENTKVGSTAHSVAHFKVEGHQFPDLFLGFCATSVPKNSEDVNENVKDGMKYMTYLINGRFLDHHDLSARTLPLSGRETDGKKTIMTYDELKKYLQDKRKHQDHGVKYHIEIFERRKSDYLLKLRQYGINYEVYELLTDINEYENYLEKFFDEICSTKNTLLTNFIIPNTRKALAAQSLMTGTKVDKEDNETLLLAKALHEEAETLSKLKSHQKDLERYETLKGISQSLVTLMQQQSKALEEYEELLALFPMQYSKYHFMEDEKSCRKESLENDRFAYDLSLKTAEERLANIEIRKREIEYKIATEEFEKTKSELQICIDDQSAIQEEIDEYKRLDLAFDYTMQASEAEKNNAKLDKLTAAGNREDEQKQLAGYANAITDIVLPKTKESQEKQKELTEDRDQTEAELQDMLVKKGRIENSLETIDKQIQVVMDAIYDIEKEIRVNKKEMEVYEDFGGGLIPEDELEKVRSYVDRAEEEEKTSREKLDSLKTQAHSINTALEVSRAKLDGFKNGLFEAENRVKSYEAEKADIEKAAGVKEGEFRQNLEDRGMRIREWQKREIETGKSIKTIEEEIGILKEFGFLREKRKYDARDEMVSELRYARFGSELVMEMNEADRAVMLERFPGVCEVLAVTEEDYAKIVSGKKKLPVSVLAENLVIMPANKIGKASETSKWTNDLFILTRDGKYYEGLMDPIKAIEEREKNLSKKEEELSKISSEIKVMEDVQKLLQSYVGKYPQNVIENLYKDVKEIKDRVSTENGYIRQNENQMRLTKDSIRQIEEERRERAKKTEAAIEKKGLLITLIDLEKRLSKENATKRTKNQEREDYLSEGDNVAYEIDSKTEKNQKLNASIDQIKTEIECNAAH